MTSRTWVDGSAPALSAANLNGMEGDLDRALGNKVVTATADYAMTVADKVVLANGAIKVTLPDPTTVATNRLYFIKNVTNGSTVTLASAGTSPSIDGVPIGNYNTSSNLYPLTGVALVSDGTNWWTIGSAQTPLYGQLQIDNNNALRYFAPNAPNPAFAVNRPGNGDMFTVDSGGNIRKLSTTPILLSVQNQNNGQPTTGDNAGLVIDAPASAAAARVWHKSWGGAMSPVTAARSYSTKTTSYTLGTADEFVIFNGASLTCTLPDPTAGAMPGRVYSVKNVNASTLSVVSAGTSKTIDGAASVALAQWGGLDLISDGTQWLIRSKI